MTTAKELLQKDKQLQAWWTQTTSNPMFDQVVMLTRADMFSQDLPTAVMAGANKTIETMLQLVAPEPVDIGSVKSGLIHDLSTKSPTPDKLN